ncbi:MAG: dimethylarginine dimethylaminohydrolase family protein [Desulfovibrio sp.]
MFTRAITRTPSRSYVNGITTANLGSPDYDLVLEQHRAYCEALKGLGLDVTTLSPEEEYPDATFVEDTAVVTPEFAVITNPGHAARQGEEKTIEPVLAQYRTLERIQGDGTLDGGDILMVEKHFYIGQSDRTNMEGAEQLGRIVEKYGYTYDIIPVGAGLHFKSSVNYIGKNTVLVTEDFAGHETMSKFTEIVVAPEEEYAANCLLINDSLIVPKGFEKTLGQISGLGLDIIELDVSEFRKMDGGLTCLSLRF